MKKAVKISAITLTIIILFLTGMVLTPFLFKDKFAAIVKQVANDKLKTELDFSEMNISFFHHFPHLTITLEDFILKSSPPFDRDTLVSAHDISFGVNLHSLFQGPIRINRVYINRGKVFLKYNNHGTSNFDVYSSETDTTQKDTTPESDPVSIKIEQIVFLKTDFLYSDASVPMQVYVHGLNYKGQSDLDKDILRLASKIKIDSLDFSYNNVSYIKSKPVKAELLTSVDMNTLKMKFEKNNFHINEIPFEFKGEFNFRKDGYTFFISLFSMFGEEYLSGSLWLVSSKNLFISLKTDINLTLQNWAKGFGVKDVDLKGLFSLKLKADGEYYTGQNPANKNPDTIPLCIPDFTLSSSLKNGFFHYKKLPSSIDQISFILNAFSKNHDYHTISVQLENLKASFLKNKIEGYFKMNGMNEFPVDAMLTTRINLAEISQVIPLDSLHLKGFLDLALKAKGKYAPEKKQFPVTEVALSLKDGELQTKFYPHPIEQININTTIHNQTGKLSDTRVRINQFAFTFLKNPFEITADLSNPDNLTYRIASKGTIDIAKIYHLFSTKGMSLDGFVSTDLNLQGNQSDALAGRVDRLHNTGKLVLQNIILHSENIQKPIVLNSGIFRFENDKIWFEKFDCHIDSSDIEMNGYLSNVVNYVLADKQTLKGNFSFRSNHLKVENLLASQGNPQQESSTAVSGERNTTPLGVFVVPENLEIALKADLKNIRYGTLSIKDFSSQVEVKKGMLLLKEMKFDVIGCQVNMEATYGSINPGKAFFDFHIKADEFDIKRAYEEVDLIKTLITSAGNCEGIVSLDYSLKGKLDHGMNPIYPSLEGGGVLSLKKVKVMGLKLFTAMSKNLDKEKIKDPDLTKVDIKTTIKNNVITIEKTRMKISGFRFRVAGETNFNGQLNLKTRLGLPPMGIVGIPIRILGTHDNPKFKYGRGVNDKDVEETEYTDEIPKELLEKIKTAKEEDLKDESDLPTR